MLLAVGAVDDDEAVGSSTFDGISLYGEVLNLHSAVLQLRTSSGQPDTGFCVCAFLHFPVTAGLGALLGALTDLCDCAALSDRLVKRLGLITC
jgi:hypothetical protein